MDLTKEQENCVQEILSGSNVFITGSAGVGKSYLIQHLRKTMKRTTVLAFTGTAALNINGQTLHSFFELSPKYENFEQYIEDKEFRRDFRYLKWDSVIIDEISMVSPDLLQLINEACQYHRNSKLPFGGIQMIFFGDFLQLKSMGSERYLFETPLWTDLDLRVLKLTKVLRQTDEHFINCLQLLRKGVMDDTTNLFLQKLCENKRIKDLPYTILVATNAERMEINTRKLRKLLTKEVFYYAQDSGKTDRLKPLVVEKELSLKVGATCMLLKNSKLHNLVNGSIGKVLELYDHYALVKFEDKEVEVGKVKFEVFQNGKTVATRVQIPLCISYAMTITKSQGSSVDNLIVDASRIFTNHQLYVALSRARKKETLLLRGYDSEKNPFKVDDRVIAFYDHIDSIDT